MPGESYRSRLRSSCWACVTSFKHWLTPLRVDSGPCSDQLFIRLWMRFKLLSDNNKTKKDKLLHLSYHFSLCLTVSLLFNCHLVAWRRDFPQNLHCVVYVIINKRSFESFMCLYLLSDKSRKVPAATWWRTGWERRSPRRRNWHLMPRSRNSSEKSENPASQTSAVVLGL